jgi:hypothetical protein
VKWHFPFPGILSSSNFSPIQTTTNLNLNAFNPSPLGPLDGLTHDPTEGNPSFKLLCNIFSNQSRIGINPSYFNDIDPNLTVAVAQSSLQTSAQFFNSLPTSTHNHARASGMNLKVNLIGLPLNPNLGNTRAFQAFQPHGILFKEIADDMVFLQ